MIIAIDPSIANVGWCIASHKDGYQSSGVIKTDNTQSDAERLHDIYMKLIFVEDLMLSRIKTAFIEMPDSFSFARSKGAGGAGLNQASLHKLNRAIGAIMLTFKARGINVNEVKVSEWKGRRNKKLDQIIAKQLSGKKCGPDESDAICLAEYCRGRE